MAKDWRRESLTWGKRLVIVILIMAGLFYGVVSLAQRSTDPLRKGLEDYLTKSTGHVGEITDLVEAKLVPLVLFKMKGINIRDAKDEKKIYVHADSAYISTAFWRMMLAGGFYALEIKGLEIATGYLFPQKLTLDFAGISDPDVTVAPYLMAQGEYNKLPLLVTMEMERKQTRRGPVYTLGDNSMTSFKLGTMDGEAITARGFNSVSFESARLQKDGMIAEFTAKNIDSDPKNINIKGMIEGVPFNALLTGSVDNMTLKITPENTDPSNVAKIKRFTDAVMKDLALEDNTTTVHVEITGASAATENEAPEGSKK